jgi:hypothetical protein
MPDGIWYRPLNVPRIEEAAGRWHPRPSDHCREAPFEAFHFAQLLQKILVDRKLNSLRQCTLVNGRGPVKDHGVIFEKTLPWFQYQKLKPILSNCILVDSGVWYQSRAE